MTKAEQNIRVQLERTKERLAILEEINLLDSEFKLIEHEYKHRQDTLTERLKSLE